MKKAMMFLLIGTVACTAVSPGAWAFLRKEKKHLKEQARAYEAMREQGPPIIDEETVMDDILKIALLRNAEVEAAFYRWKTARHGITDARSLQDPEFSFKTYFGEGEMYSVEQSIPFPLKLYLGAKAAQDVAGQEYADFLKKQLEVIYEVKDVLYEGWFLQKMILVTEQNRDFLRHFESVAQSKFRAGQTRNQDLLKAQVELGRLENEIITLRDYREPLEAKLNALLRREIDAPLVWPLEMAHAITELEEADIFNRFRENNPDLIRASRRIEETRRRVWLARMDYAPDLTVGFDYMNMRGGGMPRPETAGGPALMFKVNVPLWFDKQKSRLDEAHAIRRAAEAQSTHLELDLGAQIKMLLFRIRDARRQILLYRDGLLPKAEQSLRASETAYTAGDVDFQFLIDSERTLLEFQLAYYRAIREYEQRFAELEMMVGEPLRG